MQQFIPFRTLSPHGRSDRNYYVHHCLYAGYYDSSYQNVRSYIKHNAAPTLSSGDVVIKAELRAMGYVCGDADEIQINAYAVTEEWSSSGTTWNNQPEYESEILDFQIVDSSVYKTFFWDITSAVQRWYSGDLAEKGELANNGIMLMAPAAEDSDAQNMASFFSSDSAGSIPKLLIYYRNTTGIESYWDYTSAGAGRAGTVAVNNYTGNLVVSRTDMAYGGNLMPAGMTFTYNTNDYSSNIGFGSGWRANYSQTVSAQTISGIDYYCWIDGDGTRIYFYDDEGTWKDENGLSYTLTVADDGYTITDRDSNKLVFDSDGRLTQVIDGKISTNKIQIAYTSGQKISTVTDGAGRKYNFSYGSDGNLSSISYVGSGSTALETVSYTYSDNQLTTVTYADSNTASYTYTDGYLTTAAGCQNDSAVITYGTGSPARVKTVTTKDSSTTVSSASFLYGDNYTKVTDNNGRWCVYQFNNLGNTVSVYNQRGQALYGTYSDETPNQLLNSSRLQDTVTNLLSTRSHTSAFSQSVAVTAGKSYTLSGTGTGTLTLTAGSISADSPTVTDERTEVTITVPSGTTSMTLSGSGGFSDLQLEQTEAASRYNLLLDGDMTAVGSWSGTNTAASDGATTAETGSRANLDTNALAITGEATKAKQYTQTLSISGSNGDSYSFGVWAKAASVALDNTNSQNEDDPVRRFGVQVRLMNGSEVVAEEYVAANEACAEWQFLSGSVQADAAYTSVEYALIYDYNANTAYFDGAQLFKETFAYVYTYDDSGRIATVTNLEGHETAYEYRGDSGDITKITLTDGAEYSYTYNENNLLSGTVSATGVETAYEYDSHGNLTQTTVTYATNAGAVLQSNQTYTADGNFLSTVTGTDRNTITYTYDTDESTLTSTTDPKGNTTSNTYDDLHRLLSVTSGDSSVSYTYAKDRLSKITTKSSVYNFTYTTAGLTDTVRVGNAKLVDNAYNPGTWTLASQTYGNGDAWHYTYNDFDELVSAYTTGGETGTELKYFYNSEGALARIEQYDTELSGESITSRTLVSTERYYYDSSDRSTRVTRTDADGDTFECYWEYDHNNNITTLVEVINGVEHTYTYTYDNDQRLTAVANGDVSTRYTYDGFGRLNQQATIHDESTVMVKTIFYQETADHQYTTGQVSTLSYGINDNIITYTYTYDANGNIISITEDNSNTLVRDEVVSTTTSYTYDSMNQLIQENNEAAGKIWTWTYDDAGNIRSRNEYTIDAEGNRELTDTVTYTYGDSNWGDLLTAYDGVAITHDAIGNPLNDGTWTYTWENGRQLASMSDGDTTWTYKYNADGLRTKRTNGSTTYEYTYSGDQLVQLVVNYATESETASRDVLYFTSDTVTYNGTTYYYVTNLQGDVIAILNGDGNPVVTYSYNAWGSLISTSGTMADTLGVLNPLRYRGYVYDSESGLYYLQSRYYDPEMGRFINADSYASTGQGILGNNMFAYCLNNPIVYTDDVGELPAVVLPLWDYWRIHKMVQQDIVLYWGYEMEVYVKSGNKRGFLDLYDVENNQYYEVKHAPAASTAKEQMDKYDVSHIADWRFWGHTIEDSPTKGNNIRINGSFSYSCYTVTYRLTSSGLITYSVEYSPAAIAALAAAAVSLAAGGAARGIDKFNTQLKPAFSTK